jgi:hypothetical protein
MALGYIVYPHNGIPESVLRTCAENFSSHYGIWRDHSRGRVKMSARMVRQILLADENCSVAICFDGDVANAVGHAFFKTFRSGSLEKVVWITQLVVHPQFRTRRIAQNILHKVIGLGCACACLVSTHPHAIFALERAMGDRKCNRVMTRAYAEQVVRDSQIQYLQDRPIIVDDVRCLVDTSFDVDHEEPQAALIALPGDWQLGPLSDGHEYLGMVFSA